MVVFSLKTDRRITITFDFFIMLIHCDSDVSEAEECEDEINRIKLNKAGEKFMFYFWPENTSL